MKDVTAIILGGGRGTRLFPLTLERAKPAVSFVGKYRLIDIPISNCINSGIKRMFVLTQFLSASLHRHIMQTYRFDTFSDGFIDILAAEQTPHRDSWFEGTADAVRATLNHTTYYDSNETLILSGDHLYRMDYAELLAEHRESGADITICVYPSPEEEASQLGLLRVDDKGQVNEFAEKPKTLELIRKFRAPKKIFKNKDIDIEGDRFLASMGIYVFNTRTLVSILNENTQEDFGKHIIPWSIDKYKLMAYPFAGYWKDIGNISTFFEANISLAQPDPPFKLYYPRWPIYTRMRSLPPTRIIGSSIKDSLVVEGSDIIGADIEDSIIGVRSIVKKGSKLKEVVMLGADFYEGEEVLFKENGNTKNLPRLGIGKNCFIEHCIIDKNVRIGDNVTIKRKPRGSNLDGSDIWVRDGITIIPKGTIIPPNSNL